MDTYNSVVIVGRQGGRNVSGGGRGYEGSQIKKLIKLNDKSC